MPKWSPKINHLSYTDDTILFCSGHSGSIKKMIKILREYERISGQLINRDKSLFYLHEKTLIGMCLKIKRTIGIAQDSFPFTYLGCPILYGRKKKCFFEDLVKNVMKRLSLWQNKLLSFGGRYILIAHVLQSIPIYLLSAMNPIHKIFAKFFLGKCYWS